MIRLTVHAERRIAERKLSFDWIEAAIMRPDRVAPDVDPSLTQSFKRIAACGGRVLKVVHRFDDADILVVTAYLDRGAER